jgi:hypothetical protein
MLARYLPKATREKYEMRLEELRAGLNSDLLEAMLPQEQDTELVPVTAGTRQRTASTDAITVNAP